jgi:DDE superfamily endonuclease
MDKSLLDLYTDYLISSFSQTTATGLSQLLDGQISHDAVTRFLASQPKTSADLWRVVKPLVRQAESDDAVLVLDDSIEEKPYTDENDLICWHWDHSQQRSVKGINFLTALYCTSQLALPVGFDLVTKTELYIDAKTGKQKRRSQLTKNARYRMLLLACAHNKLRFSYVLNDVWYASSDNMMFIKHTLKKRFVMPLKQNRKVALTLEQKQRGQYQAVSLLDLPEGTTRQVWLEGVDFPLNLVKQRFTNEDGSTAVLYLVTSDLTLNYDQMTALYKRRWSVEVYHKSLKQNASLVKSPTRTETTQRNHLYGSLCAYIKLESLKQKTGINHFALKSKIYLSALRSAYAELVNLNPQSLTA